ncbi:hypothetical protein BO94DRAFT_539382 [Aspergillus sclerotioniger CBS 115572]|uniref:Mid2 domain-containing protein n=1 Tax=Aspergillus sclerotioniger CBS 115572 TaxID=1450535 RepID=A0A317VFA7_9EURO|nr:hypothetical protein BO94DRAFT_539382 [Aspergillus sclerotioniger CBS 115572]PWY71777.1 hypothetical protein BO94DRAFT_539382 [Aspergillus sclerotioniger CBS 115572]
MGVIDAWLGCFLLMALGGRLVAGTTCYFPDGTEATNYTPCSDDGVSFCCNENSICLSNGLCTSMHQPYVLGRGACTSQSWNETSVCDDVCHGITTAWGTACSLILYSDVNGKALYCPNSIISNGTSSIGCADGVSPIQVATGQPIAGKAYLSKYTLTSSITTTNTTSNSSSSSNDNCANTSSGNTNNSTTGSNSTNDGDKVSRETLAAVGAGVGVPLGLLAMASLGYGYNERRKRVQLQNSPAFMSQMHHTTVYRSNLGPKELSGQIPLHELGEMNRHELAGTVP